MKRTTTFVQAAVLCLFWGAGSRGAVYYVDGTGGDEAHGGTGGWGDALLSITNALTKAVAPAEIWVKAGVYKPAADGNRTKSFTLKNGVDLYGGFAGTETLRNSRDWTNNATILCGDIGTPGDMTDNSYHVVVGATARFDGFFVRNGRANGTGANLFGGGMYTSGAYPITANCIFTNNMAGTGGRGGGVYWDQGAYASCQVGWYNCIFANNEISTLSTASSGGGLYANFYTNVLGSISNCLFSGNTVTGKSVRASALHLYDQGQKVWSGGAGFEIVGTLFSNNPARSVDNGDPGGVYVERFKAPVAFRDCRFIANSNFYSVANRGGGALGISLHAQGEGIRMTRCHFARNYSASGGGAVHYVGASGTNSIWRDCVFDSNFGTASHILNNQASPMGTFEGCEFKNSRVVNTTSMALGGAVPMKAVFTNCDFVANTMTSSGNGGAAQVTAPASFRNCRFEGNSAPSSVRGGGAIYWNVTGTGTGLIANCSFTTNTAGGAGGGIWHLNGVLDVRSSDFIGNSAGSFYSNIGGGAIAQGGGLLTITDCNFVSNSAVGHGGAICRQDYIAPIGLWEHPATSSIERCIFVDNRQTGSSRYGGAIAFSSFNNQAARVFNCVFRGNSGVRGGAIATENAHAAVANVTAVGNTSATTGYGGALSHNGTGCGAQVVNSIFWDNSPAEIAPTDGVTVRYSNVDGGFPGTGNMNRDPAFADTIHLHVKSKTGYYANGYFSEGTWQTADAMSPCIDAGDPDSDWSREPKPRTGRINLGAYGNTAVASKGLHPGSLFLVR